MDLEDFGEHFFASDFGFSGFRTLGALLATGLVQWAVKNYLRHSACYSSIPAACGLTGAEAARKLLTAAGVSEVHVTPTALFDR